MVNTDVELPDPADVVPNALAECLFYCYVSMKNAREYARAIVADPEAHPKLKNELRRIAASQSNGMQMVEGHVPRSVRNEFNRFMRDDDHLRLDNLRDLYVRMSPEQLSLLEDVAGSIIRGEYSSVESSV